MAKYDYGGGCPCGLYRECTPLCENYSGYIRSEVIKGNYMTKEKEHDFGFTFEDEADIVSRQVKDDKAEKIRDMIMPLLNNLKKNPEKDMINWPGKDRVKKIDDFIKKMNEVIEG